MNVEIIASHFAVALSICSLTYLVEFIMNYLKKVFAFKISLSSCCKIQLGYME